MVGNIKVLLTDDKDEGISSLANALRSSRMDVKLCQKNGAELLNLIDETNPDVVIMDAFLQHIDAVGVVSRLNTKDPTKRPLIVVLSGIDNANFEAPQDLNVIITDILHQIGVPAHIKGYRYVREAIKLTVENPEMLNSVTKILYPTVAKNFKSTSSRVERAIRHGIETAWDRGDVDVLNSYFGYTIQSQRGKPTNSEFIAMISDKIRLKRNVS